MPQYGGYDNWHGLVVLPDDPARWGPLAGTILAHDEGDEASLYSLSMPQDWSGNLTRGDLPELKVTKYSIATAANESVDIEDMHVVPSNSNLYLAPDGGRSLYGVSAADMVPLVGDLLVTTEHGSGHQSNIERVYWDPASQQLISEDVPFAAGADTQLWEREMFAPVGLGDLPSTLTPVAGRTVYLDANNNGQLDAGEPQTSTTADGTYAFTGLAQGTYVVREVEPSSQWVQVSPTTPGYTVHLASGGTRTGLDFESVLSSTPTPPAPIITSAPPATATIGTTVSYHATATEAAGDPLAYSWTAERPDYGSAHPDWVSVGTDPADPYITFSIPDYLGEPAQTYRGLLKVTDTVTGTFSIQPFTIAFVAPVPTATAAKPASTSAVDVSWDGIAPIPDRTILPLATVEPNPTTYWVYRSTTPWTTTPDFAAYGYDPRSVPGLLTYDPVQPDPLHLDRPFFRDTGASAGTTYYYYVQAEVDVPVQLRYVSEVRRIFSPFASVTGSTFATGTLAVPAGVRATPTDPDAITVEWEPNVDGLTASYDVYRGTTPEFSVGAASRIASGVTGTTYLDPGLGANARYYYRVTAVGANQAESAPSAVATAETSRYVPQDISASADPALVDGGSSTTISATATCPDGDLSPTYRWSVVDPAGVTQSPDLYYTDATDASATVNFHAVGDYTFSVYAVDTVGYSRTVSFVVSVDAEVSSITILPSADVTLAPGDTQQFTATAVDQFGQSLATTAFIWTADGSTSSPMTGPYTYTAPARAGLDPITATAADGVSATKQVRVVPPDVTSPSISFANTPASGATGHALQVSVTASDNVAVQALSLTVTDPNGVTTPLTFTSTTGFGSPSATGGVSFTPSLVGTYVFTATATDSSGTAARPVSYSVTAFDGTASQVPPTVTITGAAGTTAPDSPLEFKAAGDIDANLTDANGLLTYSVTVTNLDTGAVVSQKSYPLSSGHPKTDAVAYTLDPTSLANGQYQIDVTATNIGGATATATAYALVNTRIKLGNLRLSFTDLSVTVGGFPVSVTRTYDSLNADAPGDFGYGWSLSFGNVRLVSTAQQYGNQALSGGDHVWLSVGDGKREGFTFQTTETGIDELTNLPQYDYQFVPDAGVTDQLTNTGTVYLGIDGYLYGDDIDAAEGNNDQQFTLALTDGTGSVGEYDLKTASGLTEAIDYDPNSSQATLTSVRDRIGDELDYSSNQVVARDPNGDVLGAIDINRGGPAGTVSSISLLGTNTTINYGYVNQGADPEPVLQSVTTAVGDTVAFSYGASGAPPHYLTGITNGSGVEILSAQFDAQNRLTGLIDADGNPVQLSSDTDPNDYTETAQDALHFQTVTVYDVDGNVIRSAEQVDAGHYLVTVSEYDAIYDLTAQSKPFLTTATDYLTADVPGYSGGDANHPDPSVNPAAWAQRSTYDGQGHVQTTTDALGRTTTYTYDDGQLATVTGPNASIPPTQDFYANGQLTETIDAAGNHTTYTYATSGQAQGELLSVTGPSGATTYAYDANHNVTQSTAPGGQITTYAYDAADNATATTVNGQTSYTRYDAQNRVTATVDASGHETDTFYGPNGQTSETIDHVLSPSGSWTPQATFYDYDAAGNLLRTRYADGTQTISVYDVLGRVILATDRFDPTSSTAIRATRTVYDGAGRVTETQRLASVTISLTAVPGGAWVVSAVSASAGLTPSGSGYTTSPGFTGWLSDSSTTYNADGSTGSVTQRFQASAGVTDPSQPGSFTTYSYDADGRTTETAVYAGTSVSGTKLSDTTTVYDVSGRQTQVTDGLGHHTGYQYDALGQVTLTTFDDGSTVQDHYNAAGQKDWEKDPNGNVTSYQYDAAGNLTEVDQPTVSAGTPRTTYVYDTATGNELQQVDANHHVTSFTYDAFGNQRTRTLPAVTGQPTATEHEYYDATGSRVTQTVDFDGNAANYKYDAMGRVSEVDYVLAGQSTPQEVVTYHYDTLGRQTEVDDSVAGNTTYAYDADGHVTQTTSPQGTVNHKYDPATGQLLRTWTGDGALDVSFAYDGAGSLATVTVTKLNGSTVNRVTGYTYDLAGNLKTTTTSTGSGTLTATYGYDDLNRLTSQVNTTGTSTDSSFAYQYDAAGHRTHVAEVGVDGAGVTRTISYGYDADGRLTSDVETAGGTTTTTSYTYDLVGNRLTATTNGATTTSSYDAWDRLTQTVDGGTTTTYDYDADGNTLDNRINGTVDQVFTWDARGRMASARDDGTVETYMYDDSGNRVEVVSTAIGTTNFTFDDASPTGYAQVVEERNGSATTAYAYGLQRLSVTAASTTHVYLYDGHGSVVQLASTAGAVTDRYVYDAWGTAITSSGSTANPYRYSGMRLDGLTGLYDDNARYYHAGAGRFISGDGQGYQSNANPLSENRYLYADSDSINKYDLTGHVSLFDGTIIHTHIEALYQWQYAGPGTLYESGIRGGLGFLFPDILDISRGEVGEIKPVSLYGLTMGPLQEQAYLSLLNGVAFSWRGRQWTAVPALPNATGGPWRPSTWSVGVQWVPIPELPDQYVFTVANVGGVVYYISVPSAKFYLNEARVVALDLAEEFIATSSMLASGTSELATFIRQKLSFQLSFTISQKDWERLAVNSVAAGVVGLGITVGLATLNASLGAE